MAGDAPIFHFNEERAALVTRTIERVMSGIDDPLLSLNDAAYFETRRLDGSKRPVDQQRLEEWRSLAKRLGRMSERQRRDQLHELVTAYARDIAGHFDARVYRMSTKIIPSLVTALLSPSSLPGLLREPSRLLSLDAIGERVQIQGDVAALRELARIGTLVFVPTHLSNMDSIVFGYALERSGLPPATYGAGKNLFTNPLLAFFMRNLGAYRVDRRLRHKLYKDVLKAYSTVLIENGYHSLFFPGGTRARSGGVETHLKLGLMGTGLDAYVRTLVTGRERRVFFVPATINYLIVLEAETLIGDYLSEAGKARYIIEDDESTRPSRVVSFAHKLLGMDGAVVIRFGAPLDPFGNLVDARGVSHDRRGREVEPADYVRGLDGRPCPDAARDMQYTRELGHELEASYLRETVAMSTHVVAAACFDVLRKTAPTADLFTVLRLRDVVVPRDDLAREIARVRDQLLELDRAGEIHVSDQIRDASGGDILTQAARAFSGYHSATVIESRHDGIALCDTNLLLYYQNRLETRSVA